MRAHMACGICGPTHGAGRYFYREWVEAEGWSNNSTTQLVARDAFNGRVLWIKQEEAPWKTWRTSQWTGHNWTLGADDAGRLFAVTKDARLVCLDGATGEQRFELLAAGANPGYVQTHLSKYVLYAGTVFSAETGKQLWKPGGKYVTLHEETVLESDGRTLRARKLADGSELFKADLAWRGERVKMDLGIMHLGSHIIITEGDPYHRPNVVTALDPATGEKLWSQELGGIFALPFRGEKGKTFGGEVRYTRVGDKLLAYCHTQYYYVTGDDQKEVHFTSIDLATGKIDKEDYGPKGRVMGSACATEKAVVLGDYLLYHHNVWRNIKTMERVFPYLVHPSCSLPPATAYGMIYNSPGRKGHSIQGITAIGPADITFDQAPGGKIFQRYSARPALSEPTTQTDWPTFRANNARGNAAAADLGDKLEKVWEAKVGLGGRTYGQMYAERTGLTQATVAYGTAYVADIGAQRIVALDVKDGKQQWVYHAGSRVDFPPTLYKGLCLFASKDGFVHCLDAKTGAPGYKLLVAPRERFIGGQEKLESLWPTVADVMVDKNGVGHASAGFSSMIHGGNREVTFNVETGEVVQSKVNFEPFDEPGAPGPKSDANIFTEPLAGGFRLSSPPIEDMLGYGNSISRTNEDRANEVFGDLSRDMHGTRGRACGRVIAFDEKLCVAHFIPYGGESWDLASPMFLLASNTKPSTPLWKSDPIELVADDIVLTPKYAYCVGHYRRVKGNAEVWVVSREDGKVLSKTPVDGFPVFMGASAAGNRLFVATRDGQLICYRGYYP
jgi:outer membrane protein assembly factor BamB